MSFRTTTSRTVGMRLDLEKPSLNFWLNGRPQPKRNQAIPPGEYYLLIKMKNYGNTVILNPFAISGEAGIQIPESLLLSPKEREYLLKSDGEDKISTPKKSSKTPEQEPLIGAPQDEVPAEGSAQKIKAFEEKHSMLPDSSDLGISESDFAQYYSQLLQIYESVKNPESPSILPVQKSIKWHSLTYTDKLL